MRLILLVALVAIGLIFGLRPEPEHEQVPLRKDQVDLFVPGPGVGGGSAERFLPF